MKKIIYFICLVFACSCTVSTTSDNAKIKFKSQDKYFGYIPYQVEQEHNFEFENPGESPLIIQNVETSCGCTLADWSKKPILPGEKGEIKIKYDADYPGTFNKTITVHFNGKESPVSLTIRGKVNYPAILN